MDQESKNAIGKDGFFWIASMSKPITGVAILMLLEEGKVRLNDPESKFIPEFNGMKVAVMQERPVTPAGPPAFYTVPATREITIQDLLTHVSGLASGGPASSAEGRQGCQKAWRETGRLHPAPRQHAAQLPARIAMELQSRRGF
jgi:CubicO group peptidase (beta-lactamase class C family)